MILRRRFLAAFLGFVLLTSGVSMGLTFAASRDDTSRIAEIERRQELVLVEVREGLLCALSELGAHRQNTYAADRADARARGEALPAPAVPPRPPRIPTTVCVNYFEKGAAG